VSSRQSGLRIEGEVRHIVPIRSKTSTNLLFVRNNDSVKIYGTKK
jgi:enediyne biosynthesis protein E4